MNNSFIKLYGAQNIEEELLVKDLKEELKNNKILYLTATANLKYLRKNNNFTKENNNSSEKNMDLYTFQEFKDFIVNIYIVKSKENILKNVEQKIILEQLIKKIYVKDKARKETFISMSNELFELFNFILFHDKKEINKKDLKEIRTEYSFIETDIFDLFNKFSEKLDEEKGDKITYQEAIKNGILSFIKENSFTKVFLDGFLFFDELQKYLIKSVIEEREEAGGKVKKIIFVGKYDPKATESVLLVENIEEIKDEFDLGDYKTEYEVDYNFSDYQGTEVLKYLKRNYFKVNEEIFLNYKDGFNNDHLRVMPAFISRDQEFEFVVKEISSLLKKADNPELLLGSSEEDENDVGGIAVVIARDREKYESKLARFFREYGLFKFPSKQEELEALINRYELNNNEQKLKAKRYFSREEFLNDNDINLEISDKNKLFTKLDYIKLNQAKRPIAAYPIGQFIFKIYDIIKSGITVEDFRLILNSNWISNETNKYLKDFKTIKVFFEGFKELDDWIKQMDYLLEIYNKISDAEVYRLHPLRNIKISSLDELKEIMIYLKRIIIKINKSSATFKEHIGLIKTHLTAYDKLEKLLNNIKEEQEVVATIFEVVEALHTDSTNIKFSTEDFSTHIGGMIKDWEDEQTSPDGDIGQIAIVNLENMKHYDYTFFVGLESDKYPRNYEEIFPFSSDIIEILEMKFNIKAVSYRGIEEHLRLERYLFKNIIDFTDKRLYLSYVKKEDSDDKLPSIYLEDISSMFGRKIEEIEFKENIKSNMTDVKENENGNMIYKEIKAYKDEYTTLELAVFENLCPKMYYHLFVNPNRELLSFKSRFQLRFYAEAILYNKAFDDLITYSTIHEKVYSIHNDELYFIYRELVDKCKENVFNKFNFLTEFEKKVIRLNVLDKFNKYFLIHLISDANSKYLKFNNFKLERVNGKVVNIDGIKIRSKLDFQVKASGSDEDKKNITPLNFNNSYYIDFLALKTSNRNDNENSISKALKNLRWWDRLLTNKKNKIKKVIDKIESTDYLSGVSSKFCKYCLISDICKESYLFKE